MPSNPPTSNKPVGLHLSRGVRLRIPPGGLEIGFRNGDLSAEITEYHVQLNTCTDWLEIALEHLVSSHQAHRILIEAHETQDDVGKPLHGEFRSAMQACVAAATFFEALYAATRDCLPSERNAPRADGRPHSARSAHVAEQLKRAFGLKQQGVLNLQSVLLDIYRFRDEAVHPAAAFGPPALHPDLGIAVEQRFTMYTAANAHLLVRAALAYCEILPMVAQKQGPKETADLVQYLLASGDPLFRTWRSNYGELRHAENAP